MPAERWIFIEWEATSAALNASCVGQTLPEMYEAMKQAGAADDWRVMAYGEYQGCRMSREQYERVQERQ